MLDSGNLLFKKASLPQGESRETITASGIVDAYEKMGYDAVAVGPLDLVAGIDFLKNQHNSHFTWVSANLVNPDNSSVFKSFIIKKAGQSKTAIIGLTHRATFLPPELHIVDWQTILPKLMQKLSKEYDHIILLSNLPAKDNVEIAQGYPDIHLILSADPKFGNLSPVLTNNTLITQTANRGQHLGLLNIEWGSSGRWESDLEKERGVLSGRIDAINLQIQKMERQKDSFPDINLQLEHAINERQNIAQQIDSLNHKAHEDSRKNIKPSTFTSNFIPLHSSLPNSPDIETILTDMRQHVNDFRRLSQRKTKVTDTKDSRKTTQPTKVAGYEQCRVCHRIQMDFWKSTQHAGSFATLQKKGRDNNLECLPCHVTHSGDFFRKDTTDTTELLDLPTSMQAVGCEMCHGEGRLHAGNPESIKPIRNAGKQTCLNCHTKERDPKFDYEKKRKQIQCPANQP